MKNIIILVVFLIYGIIDFLTFNISLINSLEFISLIF